MIGVFCSADSPISRAVEPLSPLVTLKISELTNKYPKKYPKKDF